MVLRDLYCVVCDRVVFDVETESSLDVAPTIYCENCCKKTLHATLCNGGCSSRWRYADAPTDPDWNKGRTHAFGVSVNGQQALGDGDDKWEAKRDKLHWDVDRRYNKTPLHFDQKRR